MTLIAHAPERVRPARVLTVMCAGMFLVLLDVTAVNVALPSIGHGLRAGIAGLQWTVDGYAVAIASLLLAGGTVGDRLGHRRVLLAGFAAFGLASLACAMAPSVGALVAGRVAQGVGGALLLPSTMAVIADAYPDRAAQARALGTWAAVSSLALPAGPLLGGLLVGVASWRLVFWVNVPLVALTMLAAWRVVAAAAGRGAGRFDVHGLLALVLALAGFVFTIISAGRGDRIAVTAGAGLGTALALAVAWRAERRRGPGHAGRALRAGDRRVQHGSSGRHRHRGGAVRRRRRATVGPGGLRARGAPAGVRRHRSVAGRARRCAARRRGRRLTPAPDAGRCGAAIAPVGGSGRPLKSTHCRADGRAGRFA